MPGRGRTFCEDDSVCFGNGGALFKCHIFKLFYTEAIGGKMSECRVVTLLGSLSEMFVIVMPTQS